MWHTEHLSKSLIRWYATYAYDRTLITYRKVLQISCTQTFFFFDTELSRACPDSTQCEQSRMECQSISGLHIYGTQPRLKTGDLLLMFHLLCWVNRFLIMKYMTTWMNACIYSTYRFHILVLLMTRYILLSVVLEFCQNPDLINTFIS